MQTLTVCSSTQTTDQPGALPRAGMEMADSIGQRTTYTTARASSNLKFFAMRRLLSKLGVDPKSRTHHVRKQQSNETSSDSGSSSQLLKQDPQPVLSETNAPSTGFFAGASNINANNGIFNDVAGDQYNLNKYDIKVEMQQDNDRLLLDKLPIVKHAGYQAVDHETCLEGTRREELRRIEEWEADPTDKRVYWLNGLAGYGKSTIARTFAERSSKEGRLGASFFCSRDFEDRQNIRLIFPTLAFELAYQYTEFKTALIPIIASNPNIGHTLPSTQLESLLVRPLKSTGLHVTIIIDALDECKEDQPASVILSLLGKYIDEIPFVKFFITGRPEPQIRSGFRLPLLRPHAEVFLLHEVDRESVDQDIELYVKTRLSEIVTWSDYDLPVPWPTDKEIIVIVKKSSGVFIVSSTIVRFIGSRFHDPQERMKMITSNLESTVLEGKSGIDATYRQVFLHSCKNVDIDDNDVFERLRLVIGSIIIVFNPLSCANLAVILRISRGHVRNAAHIFHSVLTVPESDSDPMRICHKSLADFVTDANRCTDRRFHIDPSVYHLKLGMLCLRLMNEMLKRNICDLPPYAMNEDIGDLSERREKYIGGGLEYACRSWAKHLRFVSSYGEHVGDVIKSLGRFFHHKLLPWLEVLSVIKDLGSAVYSLRDVRRWLTEVGYTDTNLLALVNDSERFVLRFFDPIEASASHIYDSGLLLSPQNCHIRARYQDQIQTKVKVLNAIDESWDGCSRSIQIQKSAQSIAFSHKGDLIAVAEEGCVEIFEAVTGQIRAMFTLTDDSVSWSLAFSPNDTVLVNGCEDGTAYVWDLQTGGLVTTLKGHMAGVLSVAFSPCGNMIASGSRDHTIRIWSVSTHECLCILEPDTHSDGVDKVSWFGTGSGIILGLSEHGRTVRLWDVVGARCLETFESTEIPTALSDGHLRDSTLFAFACLGAEKNINGTIKIIDAWTGDVIQTIGPTDSHVRLIRFLSQDKVMYTTRSTFFIHDLANNTNLVTFEYDGGLSAISSDGSCMASSYRDKFVRVWQTGNTGQKYDYMARLDGYVDCVAFSGDGQLIASGFSDGTVKVWEATSGRCLDTFTLAYVNSLTFSPDCTFLAYQARFEGDVRIRNIRNHTLVSTTTDMSTRFRFSPDGCRLVSLVSSPFVFVETLYIKLWEVATGDCLASIQLDDVDGDFVRVAFGTDGNSVILDSEKTPTRRTWTISPNTRDHSTDNDDHSPLPMTLIPVHDTEQHTSPDAPLQQVYYKDMDEWILDEWKRRVCWVLPDLRGRMIDFCHGKVAIRCKRRVMIVDISDVD